MHKITVSPSLSKETIVKEVINNELGRRTSITFESDDYIEVSDEYHTMHELYEHRMALNIALFHAINVYQKYPGGPQVMKSKLHNDGTMFEGYFIVMAVMPKVGQISYHYKLKHWDKFNIPEVERTPEYDGHTAKEVLERLAKL